MRGRRAGVALMNEVWALEPGKMSEVAAFAEAILEGRATNGDIFARVAGETGHEPRPYRLTDDGVAIISVSGVIARRMNLFAAISGGCSTELLNKQVRHAVEDPAAKAILLDIDSPGGGVFGLHDLSETIRQARDVKPVIGFTAESMCSAAYWIGSSANEIICTADAEVGSVGVAGMHFDRSKKDESEGLSGLCFSQANTSASLPTRNRCPRKAGSISRRGWTTIIRCSLTLSQPTGECLHRKFSPSWPMAPPTLAARP